MLSIDANLLLYAASEDCPEHRAADSFLASIVDHEDVAIEQGVREFATANARDFHGLGFDRVWNPLA